MKDQVLTVVRYGGTKMEGASAALYAKYCPFYETGVGQKAWLTRRADFGGEYQIREKRNFVISIIQTSEGKSKLLSVV